MKLLNRTRMILAVLLAFAMILSACSAGKKVDNKPTDKQAEASQLLHADSHEALLKLLKENKLKNQNNYGFAADGATRETGAELSMEASDQGEGGSKNSFSGTNIQTAGVDEADIVKTDGSYLYVMANNRIVIVDIRQPQAMNQVSVLEWQPQIANTDGSSGEYPVEFYLDTDRGLLTVLIQGYSYKYYNGSTVEKEVYDSATEPAADDNTTRDIWIDPVISSRDYTGVYIYDIQDPATPLLKRSFSQDGSYASSRRIGGSVYVISQKYNYSLYQRIDENTYLESEILPTISQNGSTEDYKLLPADQIMLVPEGDVQNQAIISTINTDALSADYKSLAVLGSSGVIYSSTNYLYLAAQRNVYPENETLPEETANAEATAVDESEEVTVVTSEAAIETIEETDGTATTETASVVTPEPAEDVASDIAIDLPSIYMPPIETYTDIYRFDLEDSQVTAAGYGTVAGWLLNQFSLDEYNGYLRVAVTEGEVWGEGEQKSSNNLYVLDSQLQTIGSVKGLARGESIKSVRFMGDKAWIVTFRTTDPLFGLDLSNPAAPAVLGELKIPGYSAYLHPISENTMLGFGYDVEVDGDNAYEKGLKLSLFDISNLSSPIEKAVLVLGGSGSWSDVLYQHKSLMADPENALYAFPAILANYDREDYSKNGAFFQGLLLINATDVGLSVQGSISQIDGMNDWTGATYVPPELEYKGYGYSMINRGIRVNDVIYTLSQAALQANRLDDLSILAKVELPGAEPDPDYREYFPENDMGE